jgi:mannose-1-phosphate guanylyltransferase/mannose-6-phosphate isomerase
VKKGAVLPIDTRGSMVIGGERIIATIGLENVLVVETPDALLVSKRGDAQKVRDVVATIKKQGGVQAVESTTVYRPWGSYTVLETGPGYKLKRIEVKPKAKLSLQMHHHRSEHWVVLSGTARVTIGRRTFTIHPNESTYIPLSTKHRLENPGRVPLKMIEVQNGEYTGEDDIVRFDDRYDRK